MATPERTVQQRRDALDRANQVRTEKARLKRDLKAGRVQLDALLLDPPDVLRNAKLFELLLATPKIGRVKANKVLARCRISLSKTVGGLSQRQRDEVVAMLRMAGPVVSERRREYARAYGPQYRAYVRGDGPAPFVPR